MRLRTLRLLLGLWCVLVIAPAVVATVAIQGDHSASDADGGIVAVWVIGYLLQFVAFFVIAHRSAGAGMVGWFVSSLLPWVAYWSAPVSLWWLVPCTVAAVGYAYWLYWSVARSEILQRRGIPARGIVLEVVKPRMNVVVNNVYIKRTLRLRIERSDGVPPYEAKYRGTFMLGEIPSPGSVLALRVDPHRPQHFEASENAYSEKPNIEKPPDGRGIAAALKQVTELHRTGALSDDEFATAKRRILGG